MQLPAFLAGALVIIAALWFFGFVFFGILGGSWPRGREWFWGAIVPALVIIVACALAWGRSC